MLVDFCCYHVQNFSKLPIIYHENNKYYSYYRIIAQYSIKSKKTFSDINAVCLWSSWLFKILYCCS